VPAVGEERHGPGRVAHRDFNDHGDCREDDYGSYSALADARWLRSVNGA
jgi:hypothetical protein